MALRKPPERSGGLISTGANRTSVACLRLRYRWLSCAAAQSGDWRDQGTAADFGELVVWAFGRASRQKRPL